MSVQEEKTKYKFPEGCPRFPKKQKIRNRLFRQSKAEGRRMRPTFDSIESFCMFIGYPRSGHSLIGALLDAHAEMVIAHECDALAFVADGFDREQIFALLVENATAFGKAGRRWNEFDYTVAGQAQGRYTRLRVIGDKKAGKTTRRLLENPGLLERLHRVVATPIRFIHVVRNPFDNIATMVTRKDRPLETEMESYFKLAEMNRALIAAVGRDNVFDMFHDDFIARPRDSLSQMCRFLGVDPPDDYLDACAAIVFDSPRKSRSKVAWSGEAIEKVHAGIARFPDLDRYRYD